MVTMTAIWDRTAEVLRGRGSMLAGIAALLILLPALVQDAVAAYGGRTPGTVAAGGLVSLVAAVLSIWGGMALVAAASDPATDRAAAIATGARRLGPAIGLGLLLALAVGLALVPAFALFAAAGVQMPSMTAMGATTAPQVNVTAPGLALAGGLYLLALIVLAFGVGARLALFWPVVVNERRGVGAFGRSFALTRGLTWRIIGVSLLFVVLLLVATAAAQLVTALVARLVLGAGATATAQFVGAAAGAIVTAGGTVVSSTFVAQLYRVVTGREAADSFA